MKRSARASTSSDPDTASPASSSLRPILPILPTLPILPIARTALAFALRLGLGGMFVAAGALKLGDVSAFAIEIHNYQLLPALAPVLAVSLPTVEIAVGVALIAGRWPWVRAGALGAVAVLAVFTVAVASVVARGINITCGCFGEGSGPVTMLTVLRDVALLGAGLLLYWLAGERARGAAVA